MNETIVNELLKLVNDILPLLISLISAFLLYVLFLIKKRVQVETAKISNCLLYTSMLEKHLTDSIHRQSCV